MAMAMQLAAAAVISDIETNAIRVSIDGTHWWDVRPMLDERETSAECIDMADQAITYAIDAQIAKRHPDQPHLIRIITRPD